MSFQDMHWLQTLGSCKESFGLPNLFPKPWYWNQPRKTLKGETVLSLNLVKNYQVRSENAGKQRFYNKCTTLIMVIRFAPNKNYNKKVVEEQAV